MVNDACRRSHEFQDEPRGKPKWGGVHVSERLSSINRGKTSRGKPRSKPESGNPTFRDCRGARGNVTWSLRRTGRLGWRRGSQYLGSRVTPVEGRNLS